MNPWLAAYQALFPTVGVAVAAKMLLGGRGRTLKEGWADLEQRLGAVPEASRAASDGALWLHAASVGETAGAAALLKALGRSRRAFVTTSTVAGRKAASELPGKPAALLAPMDLWPCVGRFLREARPRALVVLETELWPATLTACVDGGIPFAIANARVTARSFPRYRLIRPLLAPILARAAGVAAQTEADAERFTALGVPSGRVVVTGNVKYDAEPPATGDREDALTTLRDKAGWKPDSELIWCAGSTRPGAEETAVLDAFERLKRTFPSLRLILAPRHVERASELSSELARRGISHTLLSAVAPGADCLLVDTLGRLRALYAASDVAFVGGTLTPVGGHNLLEPAASGIPVLFGPWTVAIQAPADALKKAGGVMVRDSAALEEELSRLLSTPTRRESVGRLAKSTAERFAGAAQHTADFLIECLELEERTAT